MSSELLEAFRHSAWANRCLLEACEQLDEAQLEVSLPTGAGTPLAIMKHVIGAESFYLTLFGTRMQHWDWDETRQDPPATLLSYTRDIADAWETLLAAPIDAEAVLTRTRSNGQEMRLKAGVMLAQALFHANVHREQVCAVLTSQGIIPPDVSCWAYGDASGAIVR